MEDLRGLQEGHSPELRIHGRLDLDRYRALLQTCHVGLSLKLIAGPYADTTFPSKTVEYVENGLLLISTDVSDVARIFGTGAIHLQSDDDAELATQILWAAQNWSASVAIAREGQRRMLEQLEYHAVGQRLRQFFFGG